MLDQPLSNLQNVNHTHTTCRVAKIQYHPHVVHHHVGEAVQELQRDASPNCHFPSGHRLCRTAAPKSPGTPIGRTTPPRRSQEKPQNTASRRDHPIMRLPCASPSPGQRTAGLEKTSHRPPECQQAHHTFSPKSVLLGWMAVRAFVVVPKH